MMRKAGLALALMTLPFYAAIYAAVADVPATKIHEVYNVIRKDSPIGTNVVDIERSGDTTKVKISTKILVKILYVTAYQYEHEATETWKAGQLVTFYSKTNDNGTNHVVTATKAANKLDLTVDGKHSDEALSLRPASLWDKSFDAQQRLFDPANGKLLNVKTKDLGDDKVTLGGVSRPARHYKISGDFDRDLWFDGDTLLRMELVGSDHSVVDSDLDQKTGK